VINFPDFAPVFRRHSARIKVKIREKIHPGKQSGLMAVTWSWGVVEGDDVKNPTCDPFI
jgi:hypothetical protein